MNHFLRAIKLSLNFNGRDSREQYWGFVIISAIIFIFLYTAYAELLIKSGDFDYDISYKYIALPYIISSVFSLCVVMPATVRRLHDVGKSGYWLLLLYIVQAIILAGQIILIVPNPGEYVDFIVIIIYLIYEFDILIALFQLLAGLILMSSAIVFIFTLLPSQDGANKYGPNPHKPAPNNDNNDNNDNSDNKAEANKKNNNATIDRIENNFDV